MKSVNIFSELILLFSVGLQQYIGQLHFYLRFSHVVKVCPRSVGPIQYMQVVIGFSWSGNCAR